MALISLGKTEAPKLGSLAGNGAPAENDLVSKGRQKQLQLDAESDDEAQDIALIQEVAAEVNSAAPGFINVTKAIRSFAGRYLSGESPHHTVIGVLSPRSGEGRTTVSLGLAAALAEIYDRVVLVELETGEAAPTLSTEMKLGADQGLQDYFDREASLESILWQTHKENLWLLPAGRRRTRSSRLDATSRTKDLLVELSQMFGIVVVDLPPLLTSEEAPVLLAGLTSVVIIASAGSTTTDELKQVLELCQPLPVKGVLLNQVRLRAPRWLASLFRS